MKILKKIILTCLISGQSFLSVGQSYIHFGKEGKIEKVTKAATGANEYPSVLSKDTLHFNFDSVKISRSPYWEHLQMQWEILNPSILPSSPANDILNRARDGILSCLGPYLATSPKGALTYDAANFNMPVRPAAINQVFSLETTEYDHDLNKVLARIPLRLEGRDRIEYKLIRNRLDNDIIQKHLDATKRYYRGWSAAYENLLLDLRHEFRHHGYAIDAMLLRDSLQNQTGQVHLFNADILSELEFLAQSIELTDQFYQKVLNTNEKWIASWLWYTGGQVRLNPFPYADPANLISRAEREIKELESEINVMANKKVSLEESGQKDILAFLISRLALLKQAREDLRKVNDDYTKWLTKVSVKSEVVYSGVWHGSDANKIRWLHQFDADRNYQFMNALKSLPNMVGNQDQTVVYTHNLGADDKVSITSLLTPFQPKSGLETTADAIAVELAKSVGGSSSIQALAQLVAGLSSPVSARNASIETAKSVTFGFDVATFNNLAQKHNELEISAAKAAIKSELETNKFYLYNTSQQKFNMTYDGLKNYYDLTSLEYRANKIRNEAITESELAEAKRLQETTMKLKAAVEADQKAEALRIMYVYFDVKDQLAYYELIQSYTDAKKSLIWLSAQTVPILALNLKPEDNSIYRTHAEFPEQKVPIESSNKVAYTLMLNEKTPVARQTYSKYFPSRFMPSFGVVYIPGQRSALRFDETTGQFKPLEKDFDHIEALVGAKYYPWKTNPARTAKTSKLLRESFNWKANLSRGSNFLNTFYVSGGLGVRRQLLRNYYLGLGVDIIPGMSIQAGSNVVFQKQYELENAKIKSETEVLKPFGYVGLGLDLGLVTNLIKILIP